MRWNFFDGLRWTLAHPRGRMEFRLMFWRYRWWCTSLEVSGPYGGMPRSRYWAPWRKFRVVLRP